MENKKLRDRIKAVRKTRWARFAFVSLIFFLWVIWLGNYWVLFVYPLLFDIYITLYIPWNWWKKSKNKTVRTVMSWVDSIVYALVLVYFIFAFVGQNYKIPSSSLEKTLLVGDYLWVNKMCYGPRVPQTPLHFPLCQKNLGFLMYPMPNQWLLTFCNAILQGCIHGKPPIIIKCHSIPIRQFLKKFSFDENGMPRYGVSKE